MNVNTDQNERIARLEEQRISDRELVDDIRRSLKEVPVAIKDGLREIKKEMSKEHGQEIAVLKEELKINNEWREELDKKLRYVYIIIENPVKSLTICALIVAIMSTTYISDLKKPLLDLLGI